MNILGMRRKIESTASFSEFFKVHPDSFLAIGFFIWDFEKEENSQQHLDYFIPSSKKIASFDLNGVYKISEQLVESDLEELGEVKLSTHDVLEIIKSELNKREILLGITKIIAVLQRKDLEVSWNSSVILTNTDFAKIRIKDIDGSISKFEKINLMSMISFNAKGANLLLNKNKPEEKESYSHEISEITNQEQVWNNIADKWAEYRDESIPIIQEFLSDKKGNILDLGCGSGRNLYPIEGKIYGVDFSEKQLENAKKKAERLNIGFEPVISNATQLPFSDGFFDSAICISTIHCIEGSDNRERAVRELFRVLKPGAEAMVSTWDRFREIEKGKKEEFIGFIVDSGKGVPLTVNPEKRISYKRYYYYFTEEEFLDLLKKAGFEITKVVKDEYSGENRVFRHNLEVYVRKP